MAASESVACYLGMLNANAYAPSVTAWPEPSGETQTRTQGAELNRTVRDEPGTGISRVSFSRKAAHRASGGIINIVCLGKQAAARAFRGFGIGRCWRSRVPA